jgi:hypothetical protein
MDLLSLRSQLAMVLDPFLGVYTLANGITTPALAVRDEGEALAAGTKVAGLECVILAQPEVRPVLQYKAQGTLQDWTAYLVDWDGTAALETVAGILLYTFSGATANRITVPQRIGPRHQMVVRIPGDSVVLGYTPPTVLASLELPKSISIPGPQVGDDFTLFRADSEVTLTSVIGVLQGSSSPSVTFVLRYALDRTATGTLATVSTAVTSTTTGTVAPVQQMPIPADAFVWIEITAVSGTVAELNITLET